MLEKELKQMNVHLERITQVLQILEAHLGRIRETLDKGLSTEKTQLRDD